MDPWACIDMRLEIRDPQDQPLLGVHPNGCHWGLLMKLPCGPCKDVSFNMLDTAQPGAAPQRVGSVKNVFGGVKSLVADAETSNLTSEKPRA